MADRENRIRYLVTTNIAICAMGVLFTLMRMYTRVFLIRAFGADDVFLLIGLAVAIFETVMICSQTRYGLGRDIDDVDPLLLPTFYKIMYACILGYIFACFFIKNSVVLFYRRFSSDPFYRAAVWTIFTLNASVWVGTGIPAAFSCTPVDFFWNKTIKGTCIDQRKLYTANAALNVIMDVAVVALPIPTILKTQMPLKKRLGIIGMFALGGFVCIASLIRINKLFGPASAHNPTMAAVDSHTWSMIETYMGIVVACIPTLKPLYAAIRGSNQIPNSAYGSGQGYGFGTRDIRPGRQWATKDETINITTIKGGSEDGHISDEEWAERRTQKSGIWKTTDVDITTEG